MGVSFSIIVPVYNASLYLSACIDSILAQSYKNFELILIDDGSSDSSFSICEEYAECHKNITAIHKNNEGPMAARIDGANLASGEYILCVDSDDIVEAELLSTLNSIISSYHADAVFYGLSYFDTNPQNSSSTLTCNLKNGLYCKNSFHLIVEKLLYDKEKTGINYGSILFSLCTKSVRREIFMDLIKGIPRNIKYGEDLIATRRLLDSKMLESIYVVDYCGYFYRNNSNSLVNRVSADSLREYENTILCLEKLFCDDLNKVRVFAIHSLIGVLSSLVLLSDNYSDFKSQAKRTYKHKIIWEYARTVRLNKKTFRDRLKVFSIKHRMLMIIYLYFKKQK